MENQFEKVKNHLKELSESYLKLDEIPRATSFRSALEKLEEVFSPTNPFPSDLSVLQKLKGIGPSTIKEIEECLEKGTSDRLESLREKLNKEETSTEDLKAKLSSLLKK